MCEEFRARDSRIVLWDKENSGVSDTRNLGREAGRGEYVQFVDSDDYIDRISPSIWWKPPRRTTQTL